MGDRVLVTFTAGNDKPTPAVYMHWSGQEAADYIKEAAPLFRKGDPSYAVARFCGFCHGKIDGILSLGILDGPADARTETLKSYSHGDAGVYLVNVETGDVKAAGGYGKSFKIDPTLFTEK